MNTIFMKKGIGIFLVILLVSGSVTVISVYHQSPQPYTDRTTRLTDNSPSRTMIPLLGSFSFQQELSLKIPLLQRHLSDQQFDRLIQSLMSLAHMSALSVAIVKGNTLVWSQGYGMYDRENEKLAQNTTIYLIASISKTFTATALMQLYEQGLFDLDDDINDYLPFSVRNPNYPAEKITFRMLLAHQSSLSTDIPTFVFRIMPAELEIGGYPSPFFQEFLVPGGVYYKPQIWTTSHPGETMYYANMGFGLLGYLVEILSGQSVEEYCQEHIFHPLEMYDTSFQLSSLNVSRVAVPYAFVQGVYYPYMHYRFLDYPAGGLRTSVIDLSHFLIAQMNNGTYHTTQILSPQTITLMHTVQYQSTTYNFQYGLGFQIWNTRHGQTIGHMGSLFGVQTSMTYRENEGIGVIMFTNQEINTVKDSIPFDLIQWLLFLKAHSFHSTFTEQQDLIQLLHSHEIPFYDYPIDTSVVDQLLNKT